MCGGVGSVPSSWSVCSLKTQTLFLWTVFHDWVRILMAALVMPSFAGPVGEASSKALRILNFPSVATAHELRVK